MWAFISARLRQWILIAIAVPLATALIRFIRTRMEENGGETRVTRTMRKVEDFGERRANRR